MPVKPLGFIVLLCFIHSVVPLTVVINDNGPIVRGANITFRAVCYEDNGDISKGKFSYKWRDNAIPTHTGEFISESGIYVWSIHYDIINPPGPYVVQIEVCKPGYFIPCFYFASYRKDFYINATLNGGIELEQKNKTRRHDYVSSADTTVHNITLHKPDYDYVKMAPTLLTYWFVDCTYYGPSNELTFPFNYTVPDKDHVVEALLVADFTPPPPPPTTTTTTTTTPKPTRSTTPTKSSTTTVSTTISTTTKKRVKRELTTPPAGITVPVNGHLEKYNGTFPFVCNGSNVVTDANKTYGFFRRHVTVRAPIANVNVTGNNWLQHGDVLSLSVKCGGSHTIKYCVIFKEGLYNVTGNETCDYHQLEACDFGIQRYLYKSMQHTVVIVLQNDVSKKVTPVTVTVYKVQKQAQLSVIAVPVISSMVAVVLIVFGVAYYLQNRNQFIVEVADFNFSQNYADMEYKTFKERLRESITSALFTRAPTPDSSEVGAWPSPSRKYGSMTS